MDFTSPYTRPSSYQTSPPTATAGAAALASPTYSTSPTSSTSNASPLPPNDILGLISSSSNMHDQPNSALDGDTDEWADWLSWGSQSANNTLRASQLNHHHSRDAWAEDDLLFPFEQHRPSGGHHPSSLTDIFSVPFSAQMPSPSPSPTFGHAMPASLAAAFARTPELTPERDPYLSSPPSTAGMSHHSSSNMSPFSAPFNPAGYAGSPQPLASSPLSCGNQLQDLHLGSPLHSSPMHASPMHHHPQHHASFLSSSAPTDFPFSTIFGSGPTSLHPLPTSHSHQHTLHPSSLPGSAAFSPSPKQEPLDLDADGSSGAEEVEGLMDDDEYERSPSPDVAGGDSDSDYVDSGVSFGTRPPRRSSRRSSTSSVPRAGGAGAGGHTRKPPTKIPLPVPVPNLTKKSRGRHVPVIPGGGSAPSSSSALQGRKAAEEIASGEWRAQGVKGRTYLCKICGKCFQRGEHLKRHVRSIHTHDKPHECPHPGCGKLFSRHDNLHQHMRVHRKSGSASTPTAPQSF